MKTERQLPKCPILLADLSYWQSPSENSNTEHNKHLPVKYLLSKIYYLCENQEHGSYSVWTATSERLCTDAYNDTNLAENDKSTHLTV